MSRILVVGDPHGDLPRFRTILADASAHDVIDAIVFTGDLGRADKARALAFGSVAKTPARIFASQKEQYQSAARILACSARHAPTYYIQGNVENTDRIVQQAVQEAATQVGARCLDYRVRRICGLRVGGIPFFRDSTWASQFKPANAKLAQISERQTNRVKRVLSGFGHLDVLVAHAPPYKILDRVSSPHAPKEWLGKHAGSQALLNYLTQHKPTYVFCGHIHEGQGHAKVGSTNVWNLGCGGSYVINTQQ